MTVGQKITALLSDIAPVAHNFFPGDVPDSYFTYNFDLVPAFFQDNRPAYMRSLIQVHLFCPMSFDASALIRLVCRRLDSSGFTTPVIHNAGASALSAGDGGMQHFVFECEDFRPFDRFDDDDDSDYDESAEPTSFNIPLFNPP